MDRLKTSSVCISRTKHQDQDQAATRRANFFHAASSHQFLLCHHTFLSTFIKRTQSEQEKKIFVAAVTISILSTRSDLHILQKQASQQRNKLHDDENLSTLYSAHLCCCVCHDGTEPDKPPSLARQGVVVVVDRHRDKAVGHNDRRISTRCATWHTGNTCIS